MAANPLAFDETLPIAGILPAVNRELLLLETRECLDALEPGRNGDVRLFDTDPMGCGSVEAEGEEGGDFEGEGVLIAVSVSTGA